MKVSDFAEIQWSKTGKRRVLKYTLIDIALLEDYFKHHRCKPARLAKTLGLHYQSMRKLLQSAGLWHYVSIVNGKGAGDNLKRRQLKNPGGYKYSEDPDQVKYSTENGRLRCRRKLQHTVIAEQLMGRELTKDEVVHHINGDKLDNSPSNLYICTKSEHSSLHKQLEQLAFELVQDGYIEFKMGLYRHK